MKKKIIYCFILVSFLIPVFSGARLNAEGYTYIDPDTIKEIYEMYDQMEVLNDEYLPTNEWNNPALEKECLENLNSFYSNEKNAAAKIKAVKVYLTFPKWISYNKVSSDEYNGIPTFRKTFCSYILQKDEDKYMIVYAQRVVSDCTNYNRQNIKPISYSPARVITVNASDWEDWGKVTAFKLTKEQISSLGLAAGSKTNSAITKNNDRLNVSLEYSAGVVSKAKILAKNKNYYLILWEAGDYSCFTNEQFESAKNSIVTPDKLQVGLKVSAQWTNGVYYPGKIVDIKDKTYTIQWDDGSDNLDVTIEQIRIVK